MAIPTPQTIFTRDILGNYVCNTLAEAQASGPFDVIIAPSDHRYNLALANPSQKIIPKGIFKVTRHGTSRFSQLFCIA